MKVGDIIKVHLPGEWPSAIITAIHHKTIVQARLDNHPISDLHDFKYGDVLTFQFRSTPQAPDLPAWEVSPPNEQLRVGPTEIDADAPPILVRG